MSLDKLSPEEKKMFEMAIRSIRDISDSLIKKYRKEEEREDINSKYIAVFPGISDIVKEKSYQHQDKALKINFNHEEKDKFEFIKGNITDFQRVISNLLNNAVEAIEKKEGKVEVSYEVKGEEVEIRVRDNGEGMPREMVGKINRGEVVESTKEKGHGIGMEQVIKTVKKMEGQLEVRSKEQEGTEFILRFKKVEAPKWFKDKVKLNKGDTVVILDDDILVHEIWTKRLKKYEMDITIKYFSKGIEAIEFINSIEDKSKVFLFVEYELKGQEINGIKVIEKSGMQERHILMTNKYLGDIKEFKNKNNFLKTFSKMYLNDFNININ
jgi:two-component sensor histidine kinase